MGIGNATTEKPEHRCTAHPDRIAAATRSGTPLCWQCLLEPAAFAARFPSDFYEDKK